ncbi:hypothetical protein AcV7_004923 [Taiwanofungus camphoratus]|nr:hypothetical protein AcV7_004923 [Antrodia cinnamomea]
MPHIIICIYLLGLQCTTVAIVTLGIRSAGLIYRQHIHHQFAVLVVDDVLRCRMEGSKRAQDKPCKWRRECPQMRMEFARWPALCCLWHTGGWLEGRTPPAMHQLRRADIGGGCWNLAGTTQQRKNRPCLTWSPPANTYRIRGAVDKRKERHSTRITMCSGQTGGQGCGERASTQRHGVRPSCMGRHTGTSSSSGGTWTAFHCALARVDLATF